MIETTQPDGDTKPLPSNSGKLKVFLEITKAKHEDYQGGDWNPVGNLYASQGRAKDGKGIEVPSKIKRNYPPVN